MPRNYLISRQLSITDRFSITDETGAPQFTVQGRFALSPQLSVRDAMGTEVATIRRPAFSRRYEVVAGGHPATVRPVGVLARRYEIDSAEGHLAATGNFTGRQYTISRGATPVAAVAQRRGLRERFAVEVQDEESPVLMLSVIVVISGTCVRRRERVKNGPIRRRRVRQAPSTVVSRLEPVMSWSLSLDGLARV